jgi:hypothetical protein
VARDEKRAAPAEDEKAGRYEEEDEEYEEGVVLVVRGVEVEDAAVGDGGMD